MSTRSAPHSWSRSVWWSCIVLLVALQLGLIWRFSPRNPARVRALPSLPRVVLQTAPAVTRSTELSPLLLSHVTKDGFSGSVWLESPPLPQPSLEWKPPLGGLKYSQDVFGGTLADSVQSLAPAPAPRLRLPGPDIAPSLAFALPPPVEQPSRLLIEGEIAARAPAALPALPPWTHDSLLKPTVLEVAVDASGLVISVTPAMRSELKVEGGALAPGSRMFETTPQAKSGFADADHLAERTARSLKFQPLPEARTHLALSPVARGRLVFEWQTLPPPSTNSPASSR